LPAEPAALGSDLYSRLEGIAGIKSPSLPGSKNTRSNSENGAETKCLFSTSVKNLVLKHCTWGRFFSDIACPKLKTLVINGGSNRYRHPPLAISAPMVGYLRLDVDADRFRGGISITKTMPSLDRASIHLRCNKYCLSKLRSRFDGDQSELLCSVSNATSLELSGVGTTVCRMHALWRLCFLCKCSILFVTLIMCWCYLSTSFKCSPGAR